MEAANTDLRDGNVRVRLRRCQHEAAFYRDARASNSR